MSTFKFSIQACGLSQREAADYLDVSLDTVKKWSQGKNPPPEGVWVMLSDLFGRVQDAADSAAYLMALDGISPRAWGNIQADTGGDPLPGHADQVAGAMALLLSIEDHRHT